MNHLLFLFTFLSNSIHKCYSKSLLNAEALTKVTCPELLDYRLWYKSKSKVLLVLVFLFFSSLHLSHLALCTSGLVSAQSIKFVQMSHISFGTSTFFFQKTDSITILQPMAGCESQHSDTSVPNYQKINGHKIIKQKNLNTIKSSKCSIGNEFGKF